MPYTPIARQEITTLKQFYDLMAATREVRVKMTAEALSRRSADDQAVASLQNALESLEAIPVRGDRRLLLIEPGREIEADLSYEINELKKDLLFAREGEGALLAYLTELHPGFLDEVGRGFEALEKLTFRSYITDRDGTTNNYCGRYNSSIQSVYNALFLCRFAKKKTAFPIMMTSAPLQGPGILDVSVTPAGAMIYAASKGREFIDLAGERHTYPIDAHKAELLARLNAKLAKELEDPELEKFTLIGSGLQFKFGQTTVARQDISCSIDEKESLGFLEMVTELVRRADPDKKNFRIEDTGLDIEIILTIADSSAGLKDFDKGDAVKFLNAALHMKMEKGPHLVCGDTASDLPMLEASASKSRETWSIFVTKKAELAERVEAICPKTVIVSEPDVLVTILNSLALGRLPA